MRLEEICPTRAKQLLAQNHTNRNLNQRLVGKLSEAIVNDHWKVNGETIKLSKRGRLLDGQHRLHAIIMAKKPAKTYLIDGLEEDCHSTIDAGLRRTGGHALQFLGVKNSNLVASAIGMVYRIRIKDLKASPRYTNEDIVREHQIDPEGYNKAASFIAGRKWLVKFLGSSVAAACYYLTQKLNAEQSDVFFKALASGENLQHGDPVFALRNQLMNKRSIQGKLERGKQVRYNIYQDIAYAWNALRDKRSIKKIMVRENTPFIELK
jgi:hypothetical protein|tara:strand:+ start:1430 stop:2224 length:795 start_codon:yes stop_codon:yes gene_type:complete